MEYRLLANQRARQEAQRCLRTYHDAYKLRQRSTQALQTTSSSATGPSPSPTPAASSTESKVGRCVQFYRGQIAAAPGKEFVDDLLSYGGETCSGAVGPTWAPEELEHRHDYIQWLFPLRERGVNWLAPLLTTAEADTLQCDGLAMARVLQAFRMMLRFYGTEVTFGVDTTAHVARASSRPASAASVCLHARLCRTRDLAEGTAQYDNLVRRPHNYLRISRILQFLGEVGLEPLKVGWLEYLAHEVMIEASSAPAAAPLAACRDSFFFWMETPYEAEDRQRLQRLVETLASAQLTSSKRTAATGPLIEVTQLMLPSSVVLERVVLDRAATAAPASTESSQESAETDSTKRSKRRRE